MHKTFELGIWGHNRRRRNAILRASSPRTYYTFWHCELKQTEMFIAPRQTRVIAGVGCMGAVFLLLARPSATPVKRAYIYLTVSNAFIYVHCTHIKDCGHRKFINVI